MILKLVRTPGIYLVGFMGSGKTTIGQIVADRLGWTFVDLDADIEDEQQTTIAEIFEKQGEECFRRIETEAIRRRVLEVRTGRPLVVALGGGAFARQENRDLLEGHGVTVWLDCELEAAWARVQQNSDRPLARDRGRFEALFQARRSCYAAADYRVEVEGDAESTATAICELPIFR